MNKKISFAMAILALSLLVPTAKAFDRLSVTEFQAQVVGKSLKYERGGRLIFAEDGTISGTFPGGSASGSWQWVESKVCSKISIGAKDYPQSCRFPETEGDKIRFVQHGGKVFGEATIE